MASRARHPAAGYAGVFYVEVARPAGYGTEKVYYIRYRKQGKLIEEKAGGQYRDNMSAAKAASIRGVRMEGKELSNEEKRVAARAAKTAEEARYSLNRLWSLFEDVKTGNRSLKDDRIRYSLHVAPVLGAKTIPDLTIQDMDRLRAKLEKEGKAPQTVKHVLTLVKRLLNFALQKGYVESLPGRLHISMPTVDNKVTENITQDQAKKLLQALDEEADQTMASLVRLALYTGMRRSALLNLHWDDLDYAHGFITLRGDVAKKKKTETIPMNDQARAILEGIARTTSPYVFSGKYADKPRSNISGLLQRVRAKAGLPETFRPLHGLRHSFAAWLASSGQVSMYELQKLLTHSSPLVTQRYAHLHDDALRKASGVAGVLFSQAKERKDLPDVQQPVEDKSTVKLRQKVKKKHT
jgi:integrase